MSIPVSPTELGTIAAHYDAAILITLPAGTYAKILTVDPEIQDDGTIGIDGISSSTVANVANNPRVTLVWQPLKHHGWSLIVDGTAIIVHDDGAAPRLLVAPESGMLHRPAGHADGPAAPTA